MGSARGGGGRVVSILKEGEAQNMDVLAKELGFEFTDLDSGFDSTVVAPISEDGEFDMEKTDLDEMRRYLEDTLTLLETDDPEDELRGKNNVIDATFSDVDDDEEENKDEEEHFQ